MKVSLLGMMSQAHWTDPVCYVTCNVTINKVLGSQEQEFYYNIYGPYTSFYFWLVTVIHCKTQMLWGSSAPNLTQIYASEFLVWTLFALGCKYLSLTRIKILLCTQVTVFKRNYSTFVKDFSSLKILVKKNTMNRKNSQLLIVECEETCWFLNTFQTHTLSVHCFSESVHKTEPK